MQQLSEVGQHGAPRIWDLILIHPFFHWKVKADVWRMMSTSTGNLRVDMDGMPLEGNIVLSCVQQDRFGGMLCLIFIRYED